ncbi:hypothetical protein M0R45_036818 [Rubus argutus]|uniref:Uncharacterized protein n=1 Tax=Rubus argutus TaxID=59490 RepID=A0AAW1VYL5_RUBAR
MNPQLQSINLQDSVATMQQNNVTCLQQNPMSSLLGVSTSQKNMMNLLQPSYNMVPGQGNTLNSLQQVPVVSIQHTHVSAPQQVNMNALSSQSGINMLQSNSGILHNQHLKQQMKQIMHDQLNQQRQLHEQLMQKDQIMQQQQQQRLQLEKQAKQQLPGQLQTHQMPEFHLINVVNDGSRNALSSESGINCLQSNSGIVHDHNLKQQEQKMFQNQLKQSYQQLQMQKPQLLQEKHTSSRYSNYSNKQAQLHHIFYLSYFSRHYVGCFLFRDRLLMY